MTVTFASQLDASPDAVDVTTAAGVAVPFTLDRIDTDPYTFELDFANPLPTGSYVVNVTAADVQTFFSGNPLFTDQTFPFNSVTSALPTSQVASLPAVSRPRVFP